jgi:hypothetical protein
MWHAGEGDMDRAFRDLESTHRLARLVSQDPTLIGALVSVAIDSMADRGDVAVVTSGRHSPEQLADYLARLDQLAPLPSMADRLDSFERLMFVDVVVSLARGKVDKQMLLTDRLGNITGTSLLDKLLRLPQAGVDWNAMLREGHSWYDRLAEAMRQETFAEQQKALETIDAKVKILAAGVNSPLRIAAFILSDNKSRGQIIGKQIGDSLIALMLPAADAALSAEHRGKMLFDLSRVAIALEIYRADEGEYPDSLATLTAGIMQEVPQDRFSGQPLHYARRGEGYLLYSVGKNGKDDAATSFISSTRNGEHVPDGQAIAAEDGDDLVVRVPLPE